jgi:hypothetical protein
MENRDRLRESASRQERAALLRRFLDRVSARAVSRRSRCPWPTDRLEGGTATNRDRNYVNAPHLDECAIGEWVEFEGHPGNFLQHPAIFCAVSFSED